MGASACFPAGRRQTLCCRRAIFACSSALTYRASRASQGLLRRAGSIDAGPVERAQVVAFLAASDRRVGIRGVAATPGDAGEAGFEIGVEKKPAERHPE